MSLRYIYKIKIWKRVPKCDFGVLGPKGPEDPKNSILGVFADFTINASFFVINIIYYDH